MRAGHAPDSPTGRCGSAWPASASRCPCGPRCCAGRAQHSTLCRTGSVTAGPATSRRWSLVSWHASRAVCEWDASGVDSAGCLAGTYRHASAGGTPAHAPGAGPKRHGNHPAARAVQTERPRREEPLMRGPRIICPLSLVLAVAGTAAAQQPALRVASPAAVAVAQRASTAPRIDGRADDAVWQTARAISDFRQFEPRIGADPSFRTEFRIAFDDRNLYVFVRAYDPHPDSIMRALSRRDVRGPSDQIKIIVDSYNDRRTGFQFAVNPDGVKRDYAIYNDNVEDGSWNGVWDVATAVDSLGWTAEFRIPLSQLRYADAPSHTFGFGVWRDIERYRERVAWPEFVPTRHGLASQLGRLEGITGIRSGRHLEVTPYIVTKNVTRPVADGTFERRQQFDAGADLKLGITPNITLDATINPDFGQVEADPAVLNLSAFETFVAERRPFFVEGMGLYRFELNCYIVVDCNTNEGLFYSRRIGRAPTLLGAYGDASTPAATPIAAAAKITGRTRGGLSFGALNAVTRRVAGSQDRIVEPLTNYAVLRAQQDLRGGEAGVSWIATAVNRSLDEWTRPVLHEAAYAMGLSFRNRFARNYELAGSFAAS